MTTAQQLYALNLDQAAALIGAVGQQRTVLVQGEMGTGKTTLLKTLAKQFPKYVPCYFDATTKDVGDITIPNVMHLDVSVDSSQPEMDFVRYVPNEEFGVHTGKPVILMIDEFGKANTAVKNALLRVILEREVGCHKLHPDSIVFATTNLGAEGVGDLLPAHARNRVTVITTRKPSNMEWIEWGINNGIDHALLGWCKDNPQLFQSFVDLQDPDENPYIFHPKAQRAAFVSPRSLEAASDILKVRDVMDDQTLTAALMGTIGERGGMDLMARMRLADDLPSLDSIKSDPLNAKVPDSASAVCMVVYRALSTIETNWIDAWMDYMVRLDKEAQGMFVNGVRAKNYSKQSVVMTNRKFTDWAMQNNYMFAADKV